MSTAVVVLILLGLIVVAITLLLTLPYYRDLNGRDRDSDEEYLP